MCKQKFNTALIHGGIDGDSRTGAVNVPIYQTSTFKQDGLGELREGIWEYSRTGNPTRAALEALIAQLEGGEAGFAFASGMAAITAVLSLFQSNVKILLSSNVYGGTFRVLDKVFSRFNLTYSLEDTTDLAALEREFTPKDTTDLAALEREFTPNVKAIIIESPANPLLTITDIRAVAEIAHRHGALVIVDNTFMTPYLQQPLALGADIVVHSATKYLGGHSDLVAGLAVVKTRELADKLAFVQNSTGAVLGPQDAFLLIRGIKTLAVRLDRHVENAAYLADWLAGNLEVKKIYYPGLTSHIGYELDRHVENAAYLADWLAGNLEVKKIYYPGLTSHIGYEINQQQAKNGGAMISFELAEGHNIRKFFKALQLIALAESLGGVESLVCHPATMTHAAIPRETREKIGITDNLIRLSVGIEDKADLLADLKQAIEESRI